MSGSVLRASLMALEAVAAAQNQTPTAMDYRDLIEVYADREEDYAAVHAKTAAMMAAYESHWSQRSLLWRSLEALLISLGVGATTYLVIMGLGIAFKAAVRR